MIQEEIIENNKLIAEFMGGGYQTVYWGGEPIQCFMLESKFHISEGDISNYLEYHSSWDWLMPVIEKISNLHKTYIEGITVYLPINYTIVEHKGILPVYKKVINYIKWYNEQKDNNK